MKLLDCKNPVKIKNLCTEYLSIWKKLTANNYPTHANNKIGFQLFPREVYFNFLFIAAKFYFSHINAAVSIITELKAPSKIFCPHIHLSDFSQL